MKLNLLRIARIVKEDGKYCVKSEKKDSDWSGGCYDSKDKAKKRLQEVEFFKHKGGGDIIPQDVYEGMYLEQAKESIDGQAEQDPPPSHPQMRWNSEDKKKVPLVETFASESKEKIKASCGDELAYKMERAKGLSPEEADRKAGKGNVSTLPNKYPWKPAGYGDFKEKADLFYKGQTYKDVPESMLPFPTLGEGWVIDGGEWKLQSHMAGKPVSEPFRPRFSMVSFSEGEKQNTFPESDDFLIDQEDHIHEYEQDRDEITREVGTHNVTAATPRIQRKEPIKDSEDPERKAYEEEYLEDAKRAFDGYSEGSKVGRWGTEIFADLSCAEITKASHGGSRE